MVIPGFRNWARLPLGLLLLCFLGTVPAIAQQKKQTKPKTEKKVVQEEVLPPVEQLEEAKIDVVDAPPPPPPPVRLDTAAAPDDELTREVRRFLQLTRSLELGVQFAQMMTDRNALDPQRMLPDEFFTRMIESMAKGRGRYYLENLMVNQYRKNFSLEEIKQLNAFYESPLGKKVILKIPQILQDSRQAGEQLGVLIARDIYAQLVKEGKIKEQ